MRIKEKKEEERAPEKVNKGLGERMTRTEEQIQQEDRLKQDGTEKKWELHERGSKCESAALKKILREQDKREFINLRT